MLITMLPLTYTNQEQDERRVEQATLARMAVDAEWQTDRLVTSIW